MYKRQGLLGEKLGHSYSPELHAFFGNYDYELFEVPPDQLGDFIRARDFQGLNVTIPYKTTMLAICDDLTEAAAAIGSVNTVVKQLDGSLLGEDVYKRQTTPWSTPLPSGWTWWPG